jgi:hypothetical protein
LKRDYIAEKAEKKKSTRGAMWILLIFIILFTIVIIRIATRSDSGGGLFGSMPSGDEAYEMAQDYLKPTIKSPDIEFTKDEYQYTEGGDSVYTVKSYYYTRNPQIKTNFTIKMKYTGGVNTDQRNWDLISIKGQ